MYRVQLMNEDVLTASRKDARIIRRLDKIILHFFEGVNENDLALLSSMNLINETLKYLFEKSIIDIDQYLDISEKVINFLKNKDKD